LPPAEHRIFGIAGPLSVFPRRLAAREVMQQGGVLRRGVTRRTTHVVFAWKLLDRDTPAAIEAQVDGLGAAAPISEAGFLRLLGLRDPPQPAEIPAQSLLDQSGLQRRDLSLLSLFDAFEHDAAPFSFRDLILARKYAGLIADGASWSSIARSVHRSDGVASLTALALHVDSDAGIYARSGDGLRELDGQGLLPLDGASDVELEELFAAAEAAEGQQKFGLAALLYRRCLAIDPSDSVAAFNLANSLGAAGEGREAANAYALAIKLDPEFVEAWANFAHLLRNDGKTDAARRHLARAIGIAPDYADAVYNLAALEYDAGNLAEARRLWSRYLELDPDSDWAKRAARGIHYVDLSFRTSAG
jgi:tetratricopeptide (TPR) repeat protein